MVLMTKKVGKTETARVRLTQMEKILLQERAEKMGMSISDYIKYCCLMRPPEVQSAEKD